MGARATAERFLNMEVDCGLLMAIGDGMGEVSGMFGVARRRYGRQRGQKGKLKYFIFSHSRNAPLVTEWVACEFF